MRRYIVAGNWKMNKTIGEAIELANGLKRELFDIGELDIVLCPPFTALSEVGEVLTGTNIKLGAQDMYWEKNGAYTGEICSSMLKDVGCKYVILGHSERRKYFNETNETVNRKLQKALKSELLPIVCIGETLEEREKGKTLDIIKDQVTNSLKDLSKQDMANTVVAYEPVWAVGTGKTATPQQAQEVHSYIRKLLSGLYDDETAKLVRIQYGGSVTPENIADLMNQPDIDGALVGGASLKIDSFSKIVKASGGK